MLATGKTCMMCPRNVKRTTPLVSAVHQVVRRSCQRYADVMFLAQLKPLLASLLRVLNIQSSVGSSQAG